MIALAIGDLPSNMYALMGVAVISGAGVATALGTAWFQSRVGRKVDAVHGQVANGHSTNLRDDITKIDKAVESLGEHILIMRKDMAQHREDVSDKFDQLHERIDRVEDGRNKTSAP